MAKARAAPKRAKKGEGEALAVAYGGVSYGDKTCRLAVVVSLGNLIPADAVKLLVGKRLKVVCTAVIGRADQQTLTGDPPERVEIAGTADVKSIGIGTKAISFGLTFPIEGFDEAHKLPGFAKRDGFITILDREDIPEESARLPAEDDEGDDEVEEGGDA